MPTENLIKKFDKYIESRTSIILNWFWKSGLFLFLIGLLFQNLNIQKINSDFIVQNNSRIERILIDTDHISGDTNRNTTCISELKDNVRENKSDIKYLRRDVDGLLIPQVRIDENG